MNGSSIGSVGPIAFSFQPSISISLPSSAQMQSESESDTSPIEVAQEAFRIHNSAVYHNVRKSPAPTSHDVSLTEIFGARQSEIDQTSELIWLETLAVSYSKRALAYPGLRIRSAAREDAAWSSTLLLDQKDGVDLAEMIFLPRPAVLQNSIVMSFVTSIDADSHARWFFPIANGEASLEGSLQSEGSRAEEVDIGFTTVAVELFSGTDLPARWKSDWLAGLSEGHAGLRGGSALTLGLRIVSMYVHPFFRHNGIGTLQANFLASLVRYTVGEILEQKASIDEALSIISEQRVINGLGYTRPSFKIILSGRSPDARGDNISKHLLKDVFSDFGEDLLSPASVNGGRRLEAMRSLARLAAQRDCPLLLNELRALVSKEFSSCRSKKGPSNCGSGARPSWATVQVFDMIDWASDRD